MATLRITEKLDRDGSLAIPTPAPAISSKQSIINCEQSTSDFGLVNNLPAFSRAVSTWISVWSSDHTQLFTVFTVPDRSSPSLSLSLLPVFTTQPRWSCKAGPCLSCPGQHERQQALRSQIFRNLTDCLLLSAGIIQN